MFSLISNPFFRSDKLRIKKIVLIPRYNGFFYYNGKKIRAIKNGNGVGVALILEKSPVDEDFGENILFLSESERQEISDKFNESDELTVEMVKHGWNYGLRPFQSKLKNKDEKEDIVRDLASLGEEEEESRFETVTKAHKSPKGYVFMINDTKYFLNAETLMISRMSENV